MEHENKELTRDELELIRMYRRLNAAGRDALLQQASMHIQVPAFQKWWKSSGRITYIGERVHQGEPEEN